ncbi:MAG: hypothetical protein Q4C95_13090, partial [Planctomycetia bacterium]|nr:hypothetical protein [Planctomycetia bacterium]
KSLDYLSSTRLFQGRLYILESALDIGYKHFEIISDPNPLELFSPFYEKYRSCGVSVLNEWPEIRIQSYRDREYEKYYSPCVTEGDFMSCGINIIEPILSERAYKALHEIISPYVEFLPIMSNEGTYITFKVLSVFDVSVLDLNRSELKWRPLSSDAIKRGEERRFASPWNYNRYADHFFLEEKIADTPIFQLREHGDSITFVTETIANCIKDNNLTGVNLYQVYPPEDKEEIRRKAYEKAMTRRKRKNN